MTPYGGNEAPSPKYTQVERERRWLVDPRRRPDVAALSSVRIEDRYLTGTRLRLRRMTDPAGRQVLKLTKKYEAAESTARPVVTAYLDDVEYTVFAALPAYPVQKRRCKIPYQGHAFSLDIFGGALNGLELLEIEAEDDIGLRNLCAPDWTVREVSEDARYQGGALSKFGILED